MSPTRPPCSSALVRATHLSAKAPGHASSTGRPRWSLPRRGRYRVRYDHVGSNGKISFRSAGHVHHLGIGAEHRGKRCILIADENAITVIHLTAGVQRKRARPTARLSRGGAFRR